MDKQVLTSVKASETTGRYVAGVLKNGNLLLCLLVSEYLMAISIIHCMSTTNLFKPRC